MRILMLTLFVPHRGVGHGAATVDAHYAEYFGRRHDLTVAAFTFDDREAALARELAGTGVDVRTVPFPDTALRRMLARTQSLVGRTPFLPRLFRLPAMTSMLQALFQDKTFDLVQIETSFLGEYLPLVPADATRVLMELDVSVKPLARRYRLERSRLSRTWHRQQWLQMRRYEPALCRRADRVYAVSKEDCALLGDLAGIDVGLFRYGVDPALLSVPLKMRNDKRVLFLGAFLHQPNVRGLEWFAESVLPEARRRVPDLAFWCIGRNPPAYAQELARDPANRILGWVGNLGEQLAQVDVGVVPLLSGGGVKLKTLEMLAAGKAVVTTPIGIEGIDARDGEHLLVARTEREFADKLVRLLTDDHLRRQLGAKGRELVCRDHQWAPNLAALERDYLALTGQSMERTANAV